MTEKKKRLRRAALIGIPAFSAAAALLLRSAYERRALTVPEYRLYTAKPLSRTYTFMFLSDLHNMSFGEGNRELVSAIDRVSPDAVLIGGDMMTVKRKADLSVVTPLLSELSARYPVFYGEGNHEARLDRDRGRYGDLFDDLLALLEDLGIPYLRDRSVLFSGEVRIGGVSLEKECYGKLRRKKLSAADITDRLGEADREHYQVLLMHSPAFFESAADWGADLTLSGHFHGGTIRLPGGFGLMTPQLQFLRRDCEGLSVRGDRSLIVSAGLGTHSVNLRINNKPQAVVVRISEADRFCG